MIGVGRTGFVAVEVMGSGSDSYCGGVGGFASKQKLLWAISGFLCDPRIGARLWLALPSATAVGIKLWGISTTVASICGRSRRCMLFNRGGFGYPSGNVKAFDS